MSDKILLEAFDKIKAIEESDDPFCLGEAGIDKPVQGYTEITEGESQYGSLIDKVADEVIATAMDASRDSQFTLESMLDEMLEQAADDLREAVMSRR